ncbi:MAG: sigma-E processing peptidase SpoIIGA [Lachnospiraceae bacterium]|nr:sigma-E processing peptidase SpoIIGA [Lachnospiraceae bacterium]
MILFYVVYIDEVFFVNFIMNMILLYMVKRFRGLAATAPRIAAGAALGGGTIVILCLVSLPAVLESIITLAALPFGMLLTAFHTKNIKSNVLNLITLYLNTAMTGGLLQIIFYHTTLKDCLYINYDTGRQVPPGRFVSGIGLLVICICMVIRLYDYRCRIVPSRCSVRLTVHGKKICANALIDTGNGLYEPISHQPVCIIYYPLLKKYIHHTDRNKLRIIPARTIGGGQGYLYAILIDRMEVLTGQWKGDFKNVYVALENKEFCGCQVLLHPAFLKSKGSGVCEQEGHEYGCKCAGSG